MQGFRTETIASIVLTAGPLQNVDLKLSIGTTNEFVEVVADSTLLDAGSANIATTLSTQEVTGLPSLGRSPLVMGDSRRWRDQRRLGQLFSG